MKHNWWMGEIKTNCILFLQFEKCLDFKDLFQMISKLYTYILHVHHKLNFLKFELVIKANLLFTK